MIIFFFGLFLWACYYLFDIWIDGMRVRYNLLRRTAGITVADTTDSGGL
jgi:hypothetical protein